MLSLLAGNLPTKYMDEAIHGTFTEETKRFWRVWTQVKKALDKGKLVDAETTQIILNCTKKTAYQWIERLSQAGLIRKVEQPRKGVRAKVYFVASNGKATGKGVVIEMKKLFDVTAEWLTKHGVSLVSQDNQPHFHKHTLYTKKSQLPFSGFTTLTNTIDSLPDAILITE